jgi:hypothetical protein
MTRKIGLSKQMPKSEARPLGTKKSTPKTRAALRARLDAEPSKVAIAQEEQHEAYKAGDVLDLPGSFLNGLTVESGGADALNAQHDYFQKVVYTPIDRVVDSVSEVAAIQPTESAAEQQEHHMTLTFVKNSRNGKRAIYSGAALSLAFPLALFVGKTAPATITDLSSFVEKVAKTPKAKLSKEERAALPKPTLAEKIARREALLAKDKAKLAAASQM